MCNDPVMFSWMLRAPEKRRKLSWDEVGIWHGVQEGTWQHNEFNAVLQELRAQGLAPRISIVRDQIVSPSMRVGAGACTILREPARPCAILRGPA